MITLRVAALCAVAILLTQTVTALPRFASRSGAKCQSCHVNPSGGGMRSPFGSQYGRDELPVPTWSEDLGLDDFSTQLTDFVSIGADVRTLFFYVKDSASNSNAFWQMQGDVYMNFQLAKKVNIYIDKGLYSGFEVFGLLNILPANGHIKVGKFTPNYGMKVDDHTVFVRQELGFSQERGRPELTGAEVGFSPGPVTVMGGVYNAADGFGSGVGNNKALLGRVDAIFPLAQKLHLGLGGNVFRKETGGVKTTLFGGMGSLSYQQFTVLGEVDLARRETGASRVDGLVVYAEAGAMVVPGVDLKVAYDFYDPDKDNQTGSVSRYSFGVEFFPISGVEVRPMYRLVKEDPVDRDNDEFHFLVHFYF